MLYSTLFFWGVTLALCCATPVLAEETAPPISMKEPTPINKGAGALSNATLGASIVLTPMEFPPVLPTVVLRIPTRYTLGAVYGADKSPTEEEAEKLAQAAVKQWGGQVCQIAWYKEKKPGGLPLAAITLNSDGQMLFTHPSTEEESRTLEKKMGYPTSPSALTRLYQDNQVVAEDDFKGKPVVFTAVVADIARGAFNRPYVFFPSEADPLTGLTCYFEDKDPNLRKIRKGLAATVRGTVKGFLMQDVLLDPCIIVAIQ